MRRARARLGAEDRVARAASATTLLLGVVGEAGTVMVFYSFGSELATAGLVRRLEDAEVRVLLPRLSPEGMEAAEAPALETSGYGPMEPTGPAVDPAEIDAVVVPGLAFDGEGRRLGYGGGHYDRFLPQLREDALRIGLGFDFQVVEEVPSEAWDEPVDIVVTDAGVIEAGRTRGAPPL